MSNPGASTILDANGCLQMPLDGTSLIEASAGTGKTYTIANLYLRHILGGRQVKEILVVTFTNAATEELRGRIRKRLLEAQQLLESARPTTDEFLQLLTQHFDKFSVEDKQKSLKHLQLAVRSMDEASILTIHGFCQRALSEYALNSGQAFDSTLLSDDSELWDAALKDWWRQQSYPLSAKKLQIFNLCLGSLSSFSRWQLVLRHNKFERIVPCIDSSLDELFKQWQDDENRLEILSAQWQGFRNDVIRILEKSPALKRTKALPYHPDNFANFIAQCDVFFNNRQLTEIPSIIQLLGAEQLHQQSKPSKQGTDPDLKHAFFIKVDELLKALESFKTKFRTRASVEAFEYSQANSRQNKIDSASISYDDQLEQMQAALQAANGEQLASLIRQRFPVAMIDEFQDTDNIQYDIFHRLYFNEESVSLTMIGDPKQAIYSFRGGDIFTYMAARQEPSVKHYSLQTNWRSEPELVNAVNYLFSHRNDAFVYSDSIEFHPVIAAEKSARSPVYIEGETASAITLWQIPQTDDGKDDSKSSAYEKIHVAVADEIAKLIQAGIENKARIGDTSLRSGDIAILVRTGFEGMAVREALTQYGIKAVTIGRDRVYQSDEASGLLLLLQAVIHHTDRRLLRIALSSSLLNYDVVAMAAIIDSEDHWQHWLQVMKQLHQLWLQRGFIVMFQHLLQELEISEALTSQDNTERRLTNLLHLSELLQQQSRRSAGMDSLLAWFHDQMETTSSEEAELRLESDDDLVKIVTIHKSKGLEYPVVFVPYLWTSKPRELSGVMPLIYHDENHHAIIDLGSDEFLNHGYIAEKERLAEDIRLAYVALTRARSKVYLVWGKINERSRNASSAKTALGYLLHPRQSPDDLTQQSPRAFQSDDNIESQIEQLCEKSGGLIECQSLPTTPQISLVEGINDNFKKLSVDCFRSTPTSPWHIASFSSLTRDIHQVAHQGSREVSNDDILDFPAGSRVGLLLHSIFEHLDFQADLKLQCRYLISQHAPRYGFDSKRFEDTLISWFELMLTTPLHQPGLSLSALSQGQRLNELVFDFALDHVDINELNHLLAKSRPATLETITASNFRGLVTGVIDLVFEYQGRFYLADYKSNFLGSRLEDYNCERLQQAMYDRRYDLQLLIYSIALHRFLRQRITDYNYETHFGGAYYLFLRAMRPHTGTSCGIHFERPELTEIEALDHLFASTVEQGALK